MEALIDIKEVDTEELKTILRLPVRVSKQESKRNQKNISVDENSESEVFEYE